MSGLNSGDRKDYSKYDKMSTESLEELLRLDAELPDGEGSDIDEILYISEVIAKRDKEQPTGRYSEADVDAAWETFQTKYLPYATDGRSLYDFDDDEPGSTKAITPDTPSPSGKKRISARGRRRLGRLASIAAAIALLIGIMTVTAYAMGYDLWGVIAQWTKDTFTFVSASRASNIGEPNASDVLDSGEYADLQSALDAYKITEPLAPKWIPDGFEIKSVNVDDTSNPQTILFQADYSCGKQWIIVQITMHLHSEHATYTEWQKNDENVTALDINNCTFYIMKNVDRDCAVWASGPFECSIIGDIASEDMVKILESIYDKGD